MAPSLSRGWHQLDLQKIFFPRELSGARLETDLLLLGGPKNNETTNDVMQVIRDRFGVAQVDSAVHLPDGTVLEGGIKDGSVTLDYGLVVRTQNPYCPPKRLILIAGSHTYGVVAAARFAVEDNRMKSSSNEFAVVVKSLVRAGHALPPEVVWAS